LNACWNGAFAVVTAYGGDFVLSAGHEGLCYVSASVTAGLPR
jgi:hypothetical protein